MTDDCEYPGPIYARFDLTTDQLKVNMMCVAKAIRLDPVGWRNQVSKRDLIVLADWIEQSVTATEVVDNNQEREKYEHSLGQNN